MTRFLVVESLIMAIALPVFLIIRRRMNFSLSVFYGILGLYAIGGFAGLSNLPLELVLGGPCVFAVAAGIEYSARRDYTTAAISAMVLLQLAYMVYVLVHAGAFA